MSRDVILGIVAALCAVALPQQEPASAVRSAWTDEPTCGAEMWTQSDGAVPLHQARQEILDRGAGVAAALRATAGRKLNAVCVRIDDAAALDAPAVATRLAASFAVAPEMLIAEQQQLGASWGELSVAMTLSALSPEPVPAPQLLELRRSGVGWARIAAGLGLDLDAVVATARSMGRAASGGATRLMVDPSGSLIAGR